MDLITWLILECRSFAWVVLTDVVSLAILLMPQQSICWWERPEMAWFSHNYSTLCNLRRTVCLPEEYFDKKYASHKFHNEWSVLVKWRLSETFCPSSIQIRQMTSIRRPALKSNSDQRKSNWGCFHAASKTLSARRAISEEIASIMTHTSQAQCDSLLTIARERTVGTSRSALLESSQEVGPS